MAKEIEAVVKKCNAWQVCQAVPDKTQLNPFETPHHHAYKFVLTLLSHFLERWFYLFVTIFQTGLKLSQ